MKILSPVGNFESLKNITITEIQDSREDDGKVQFSITADYLNGKAEIVEEDVAAPGDAVLME